MSIHTPDDSSRVCLTEVPGVEGSDYINASFITVRNMLLILYIYTCKNMWRHVQWLDPAACSSSWFILSICHL